MTLEAIVTALAVMAFVIAVPMFVNSLVWIGKNVLLAILYTLLFASRQISKIKGKFYGK